MLFAIGEFSKITTLTIKSLRLYHDKGILVPAKIDSSSGYRFYDEANIETARIIRTLKKFDFSLSEIKSIMAEFDEESDLLPQLEAKLSGILEKIHRYKKVSASIEMVIKNERMNAMSIKNDSFEIEVKQLPSFLIAGHRLKGAYSDMGKGFSLIGKKMGRLICGKPMGLYYDSEYKESDADFEACFPVKKGQDSEQISVRELPGCKAVTLIHKGSYDSLGESYKQLLAYINEHQYKTVIPSREVYLKGPGMIFKGNPKNYLTEIQMPIE